MIGSRKSDIFCSLDLEMNQPSGTIIQIGIVIGSLRTGEVLKELNYYISCNEELCRFSIDVSKITPELLQEQGVPLTSAYLHLSAVLSGYNCFYQPLTWGSGDTYTLVKQVRAEGILKDTYTKPKGALDNAIGQIEWFRGRWIDVKTLYQMKRWQQDLSIPSGLSKSMARSGVPWKDLYYEGRHRIPHDALADAYNTFRIAHKLLSNTLPPTT